MIQKLSKDEMKNIRGGQSKVTWKLHS